MTTEQVLINRLAEAHTSQTASKGSSNSAQYGTSTHTGRPGNGTDLHADTRTDQHSSGAGRGGTTDGTRNRADRATDTLAVMGVHHSPRTAAGAELGHRGILMRQAS